MARRWRNRVAFVVILAVLSIVLWSYKEEVREVPDRWHGPFLNPEPVSSLRSPKDIFVKDEDKLDDHPIDDLVLAAENELYGLLKKRTHDISTTAAAYRARRGRHPPPGFDEWFKFATTQDCVVVEDFFDQIYRDIEPFWGLSPAVIRDAAASSRDLIRVRNGQVAKSTSEWFFVNAYFDMFKEIVVHLPDVDLPINTMDETRVLVSWEDINDMMVRGAESKNVQRLPSITSFSRVNDEPHPPVFEHSWLHEPPYWNIARQGCPPDSPARHAALDADFSTPPEFPATWPNSTHRGYVSNWTIAKDPCVHAHIRNLHGSFVEPISQSTTTRLVPMFSGSKMRFNNDILLPPAVYWHGDRRFSTTYARTPWSQKRDEVLWRGSASGGRNTEINWTRFHRHRLLSMLNGTQIQLTMDAPNASVASSDVPHNFPLPNKDLYPLRSFAQGLLPDWIRSLSNAAFTWLVCFPATENYACSYTGSWYRRGGEMPLHRMFKAKYLPDVDGNSFSGRYRAFLQSNSLPIKATIYDEWHDDRLIAWKHFVPMDNTFVDLWPILEYLVSHDDVAEKIALEGRRWSDTVLRKEDMLVYVYRLVLEYARVSDDKRAEMGWSETRQ
ncbi:hypothetical protein LTR70_001475 [Exophiala xenobiotica]|uniref:Glycosyl transferase CAP10 domain-containing protein n=1 Tax=Lithohypha guttulata TaxID=1690604 RepID=A0ABR0KH33_9EURO|nr:hypothetical protein LTR24_002765 [Lithohypha guttulata]KAK5327852.1 hypothetical protein LTR70_001475 [Exophiala xenobiotica]